MQVLKLYGLHAYAFRLRKVITICEGGDYPTFNIEEEDHGLASNYSFVWNVDGIKAAY